MKKNIVIAALLSLCMYGTSASAGEVLFGAKAGLVDFNTSNSDPAINGGIMIGKDFWRLGIFKAGIEGEFTTSVVDGEIDNTDADFQSLGGYGYIRSRGPVYFIGRLGIVSAEVGDVADDTDISIGAGVGFRGLGLDWEVEYTQYEVETYDVDMISVGILF